MKNVLLTYKKDLLSYAKKDLLININSKYPRQILEYVKQKMLWSILCIEELHTWR